MVSVRLLVGDSVCLVAFWLVGLWLLIVLYCSVLVFMSLNVFVCLSG